MTDQNPFEAMMKMGADWAKAMNVDTDMFTAKGFEAMWPTMSKDQMEMFFGKGISPGGLDAKTRLMLTLAGLTVLGAQAEAQIRLTVRHLVEAGATKQEIAEVIAQMGMFAGVPAMNKAMELATDMLKKDEAE
ncbi:carboxymuconolactone decarboxylase family protein [Yoonia sp. SS1-5]|uniref:Carboxymuconolactone decarboxylase family protein n=1 Tax=Yoonia rhodophyticola TaxID=3137370 RepID=A0AAN0NHB6_9RHOB